MIRFRFLVMAAVVAAFLFSGPVCAAEGDVLPIQRIQMGDFSIIPKPVKLQRDKSSAPFLLNGMTVITSDSKLLREKQYLDRLLAMAFVSGSAGKRGSIHLEMDTQLAKEAYVLKVGSESILIRGGDAAGVFYGIQTLRQMMPVSLAYGDVVKKAHGAEIAAVSIEDEPLTAWRGVMVDSARHFQPKAFIKKFIDLMSIHKLNRMHWHLVDSEGWRLEIKKYPKLTEVCQSFPAEYASEDPTDKSRPARYKYGHFHGGGYYTQDDIREIVAYAKERHVEIMPEIEFPGHAMAMFTAYPEFSVTGKVPTVRSNISPDLINIDSKSLDFLRDILDETMAIFPFEMIHFGGDEAPKGQWKNSPHVQAKMKEMGLQDEHQLQAWIFNEMADYVAKKGRRPVGWEEIMHGDNMQHLTKSAVIMPWLSVRNGVTSANNGHGVIHTSVGPFYLDSWQTSSPADNWALYRGPLTLEHLYKYNLYPNGLSERGRAHIMGAQCQLWSELMPKPEHMEYQAYPRLTALSELTWTPLSGKNYEDYYKRLLFHTKRLDVLNVNYRFVDPLPLSEWDFSGDTSSFFIPLALADLPSKDEKVVVELRSTNKVPLTVSQLQVFVDGKVYSTDEHVGKTDSNGVNNAYTVKLPSHSAGDVELKVTCQSTVGSRGEVRLFKGRGRELFNPRNFAGGDYPTASWKKSDISGKFHEVRIPMDGLVHKPGDYELIFKRHQGGAVVRIGGLLVGGSEGVISRSISRGLLRENGDMLILPFNISAGAIKPGNSIFFSVDSEEFSGGDVRLRAVTKWHSSGENQWPWQAESLKGSGTATYIHDVVANKDGFLEVSFRYTGGSNGLDIHSVQLVVNGQVVAEDRHKGFTGGRSKNNIYRLQSAEIKAGRTYGLRLSVNGAGGTNSQGIMSVK